MKFMNSFIIFSLAFLLIIRIIGFSISFELYINDKEKKYKDFIYGWFLWIITVILALIINIFPENSMINTIYLFNGIFGTLAIFLLTMGFISYFISIKQTFYYLIMSCFLIIPIFLEFFIDHNLAIFSTNIFQNGMIFGLMLTGIVKRKNLKETLESSIYWFYIMVITATISLSYLMIKGLKNIYSENYLLNDIMVFYFLTFTSSILVVFVIIHFERGITSNRKNYLKDTYSHELGNILQIVVGTVSLIKFKNDSVDLEKDIEKVLDKCEESSQLLRNIRKI